MCKNILRSKPDSAIVIRSASDHYSHQKSRIKNESWWKMAKFDQDGNTKNAFRAFPTTDRFNLLFWCYLPPLSVIQDRKQSFSQETNSSHFLLDLDMSSFAAAKAEKLVVFLQN